MTMTPGQGNAYVVLLASFLGHFIIMGMCYSMGVFYVEFREVFHDTKGSVALIASLSTAFLFQTAPLSSMLVNRFGPKIVCFTGGVLSAVAFFLSMFARSLYILYATFGVLPGISLGLSYIPVVTILGGYFNKRRTLAFALAVSGGGLGNLALSPFTRYLLNLYGWRGSCVILSGISLNICVVAMLLKPAIIEDGEKKEPSYQSSTDEERIKAKSQIRPLKESHIVSRSLISLHSHDGVQPQKVTKSQTDNKEDRKKTLPKKGPLAFLGLPVFKNLSFCLLCMNNMFVYIGTLIIFTHLAAYASTVGLSPYQGSFLLAFIGIGNFAGRIISGIIVNLPCVSETCLYVSEFFVCGGLIALIPLTANFTLLACISVVFGMTYGSMCAVLPQITISILDLPLLVTGYGYLSMAAGVGSLIGSPIAEVLFDKTGLYTTSFYLAGAMWFLSAISMLYPWWATRSKVTSQTAH